MNPIKNEIKTFSSIIVNGELFFLTQFMIKIFPKNQNVAARCANGLKNHTIDVLIY